MNHGGSQRYSAATKHSRGDLIVLRMQSFGFFFFWFDGLGWLLEFRIIPNRDISVPWQMMRRIFSAIACAQPFMRTCINSHQTMVLENSSHHTSPESLTSLKDGECSSVQARIFPRFKLFSVVGWHRHTDPSSHQWHFLSFSEFWTTAPHADKQDLQTNLNPSFFSTIFGRDGSPSTDLPTIRMKSLLGFLAIPILELPTWTQRVNQIEESKKWCKMEGNNFHVCTVINNTW